MITNQYLEIYRKKRFLETATHEKILYAGNALRTFELGLIQNKNKIKNSYELSEKYLEMLGCIAKPFFTTIKEAAAIYNNNRDNNLQMVRLSMQMVQDAILRLDEKLNVIDDNYQDELGKCICNQEKLAA